MSSIAALVAALFALRNEVGVIAKDANNPFFKSKYADYPAIMEVLQPLFTKHGILWMQPVLQGETPGTVILRNIIYHATSCETMSFDTEIPIGNNPTPQAFGSAITYGRRYTLSAILNLVVDVDDDGNAASGKSTAPAAQGKPPAATDGSKISETQRKKLFAVAKETNWTNDQIHAAIGSKGFKSVNDLDEGTFSNLIKHMEKNPK